MAISSQKQKSGHHHGILHIRVSQGTKFYSKQFLILRPNLPKMGISCQKQKK